MKTVIIATPHARNDQLIAHVEQRLPNYCIVRITAREELNQVNLQALAPAWIFFPHWSWIVPKNIHDNYECVIFHMTDLPYGRGGSPLQNLIVRGHKKTKLTALKCVAGLDAGPVYRKVGLGLEGTAEEILQRTAVLMEEIIIDIVENNPVPTPQVGEVVEFKRRHPEDGDITDLESLEPVYDYIRMLDAEGYPNAFMQTPFLKFDFTQARWNGDWLEAKVVIRRRRTDE